MTNERRLIADLGGTNARFACSDGKGAISDEWIQPVSAFPTFSAALDAYLETLVDGRAFTSAAIAAAGPVDRDEVRLTNSAWHVSKAQLLERLGEHVKVRLINDLEAVAFAIPFLCADDVAFSDRKPQSLGDRMLAVNVGTGFGAASLIRAESGWLSCPSEAGHMVLGATNSEELELFQKFSGADLTVEDVLSGPGVRQLDDALGNAETDHVSSSAFGLMTPILARVSANLTLSSAAWGGVYFCGSVATAWWQLADLTEFRRLFCGNSKMTSRLEAVPLGLIQVEQPAFVGLAQMDI